MTAKLQTEAMVVCPHCGCDNRLGVPFCTRCGQAMYTGNAEPPRVKKKVIGGARRAVINAGIAAAVLWVVMVMALAIWPFPVPSLGRTGGSGQVVETYLASAARAVSEAYAVPEYALPESSLNAYLRDRPHSGGQEGNLLHVQVSSGRVVLIANEQVGPFHISTRMVMRPPEDGGALKVESLWVGHLPVPRVWARPWILSICNRFSIPLGRGILEEVRILRSEASRLVLGPRPDTK